VVTGVGLANGRIANLIYVADLNGLVAAFDAKDGSIVWQTPVPSAPVCDGGKGSANIANPTVSVVGTLTADRRNNRLFFVAADGSLYALTLKEGLNKSRCPESPH
jgi:outer membrane protein assembly factor BamB